MSQIELTQIKKSFFKSKTDTASLWYVFRCNLFLIFVTLEKKSINLKSFENDLYSKILITKTFNNR